MGDCTQALPSSHRVSARDTWFLIMKQRHFNVREVFLGFFFGHLIDIAHSHTLSRMRKVSQGREGELTAPLNPQPSQEGLLQTTSRFKEHPRFTSGFMNNRTHSTCFVLPRNLAVPE